jgi:1,4-alpha-glucan branching enzyme
MNYSAPKAKKYSAKRMAKPVNFVYLGDLDAQGISIVGDFNEWSPNANPMQKSFDGSWKAAVPLNHGHHRYAFLVDGELKLDPRAQGVTRDDQNRRVSLLSVS